VARRTWTLEEWQAALAEGEAARQADRFEKEAAAARQRRGNGTRSERFAAEFSAAMEQRRQGVRQGSALARKPRAA
jgi:hypothetical protein